VIVAPPFEAGAPQATHDWSLNTVTTTTPGTTTTNAGATVTARTYDALGRLTAVTEDPSGVAAPTYYSYDAPGNLTGVCQGAAFDSTGACTAGMSRAFGYDAVGRLITATNPESAQIGYGYDANGNLHTRTDARGWVATIEYDDVNRAVSKTYSNPSQTPDGVAANAVGYVWDTVRKGQLSSVQSGISKTEFTSYDAMGRPTHSDQTTNSVKYSFDYTYNLTGKLETEKLPSGRVIQTCYDAAGRIQSVAGANGGTQYTGNTAIGYWPSGAMQTLSRGDGLTESWTYNQERMQPTGVSVGTTAAPRSAFGMDLYYCSNKQPSCPTNNGNLMTETLAFPSVDQNFTYDKFSRLWTADEPGGWNQTYGYDQFGNRWVPQTAGMTTGTFMPTSGAKFLNAQNKAVNQMQGAAYDASGNQTGIGGLSAVWDAEGRMVSSTLNGTTTYVYDGDGRRVFKSGAGGSTTYVYDAGGNLAAEYGSAAGAALCTTCYVTVDQLGSTRVVTNASGGVVERHDYAPFGEELYAGTGARSTNDHYLGSSDADTVHPLFTGQLRDDDLKSSGMPSGLDYFGARYFSAAQGRFTSPDTPLIDQFLDNPQSWNLYAYARNNPLKYVDRTGEAIELVGTAEEREKQLRALQQAVGSKAGAYLYQNPEKDKNGNLTGRTFVGVLSGGPSGKGADFASINGASKALSGVIGDTQVAQVRFENPGQSFAYFSPTNRQTSLNSNTTGLTSPFNEPSPIKVWVLNPAYAYDDLSPEQMANGQAGARSLPDNLMHELGHAAWQMDVKAGRPTSNDPYGNQRAVDFENYVRLRQGTGRRSEH
jgi:RHS repeat-associated protein